MLTVLKETSMTVDPEGKSLGEVIMVGQERWQEIHRLFREARIPIAEISRRLDLDRKTVRRCLLRGMWQPYNRPGRADTLLAPHAEWLRERAPQVQYSARILFQELRQSRGYPGSYDTVKRFVQPLRAARLQAERALTRFETPPGLRALEPDRLGRGHRAFPIAAGGAPHLRPDLGLQPPEYLRPVPQ